MYAKKIVKAILDQIANQELVANDKLLSEKQISIKYNVSRIVATRAYENLRAIGAIYSIKRKGFFVSEHFSGLVKPISFLVNATKWYDVPTQAITIPDFFIKHTTLREKNIIKWHSFQRKYYQNDQLVAVACHWYDSRVYNYHENFDVIKTLTANANFKSIVSEYIFEKKQYFEYEMELVSYQISYFDNGTPHLAKVHFHPQYFHLTKQEYNL